MKYWTKEYEKKATADGYGDLLLFTQLYLARIFCKMTISYPLPKSKTKVRQQSQKPKHRHSKIEDSIRSKIIVMSLGMLSCRQISTKLYREHNISIHYSTVSKIIKEHFK